MKFFTADSIHNVFRHKLLVVRALVAGYAAAIIIGLLVVLPLVHLLLPRGLWAGGSFSWNLFFTVWAPIHCTHGALVGWIIAKVSREHRAAPLLLFVVLGLPMALPALFRLALDGNSRFVPALAQAFLPVVGVLAGGLLWNAPPRLSQPAQDFVS